MRIAIAVVALVLLGSAAACGGDGGSDAARLTVVGTEMAFQAPSQAPSGDYVVTFRNDGQVAHELALKNPSGEVVMRRSIGAGASADLEVALTPGRWELGCFEPGHYQAGMHRTLVVGG